MYNPPSIEDLSEPLSHEKCLNAYKLGYEQAENSVKFKYPKGSDEVRYYYYSGYDDFEKPINIDVPPAG